MTFTEEEHLEISESQTLDYIIEGIPVELVKSVCAALKRKRLEEVGKSKDGKMCYSVNLDGISNHFRTDEKTIIRIVNYYQSNLVNTVYELI